MGRKARIAALGGLVLIIAAGVWYFESPIWTLKAMKNAATADDANALSSYIDYPALRQSLEEEVKAKLMSDAQKDSSGLSVFKAAVGAAMVRPVVDAIVTPEGMSAALRARRTEKDVGGDKPDSVIRLPDQPMIERRGLSEFVLTGRDHPGSGMIFVRNGLSWKLSGVELESDRQHH